MAVAAAGSTPEDPALDEPEVDAAQSRLQRAAGVAVETVLTDVEVVETVSEPFQQAGVERFDEVVRDVEATQSTQAGNVTRDLLQ